MQTVLDIYLFNKFNDRDTFVATPNGMGFITEINQNGIACVQLQDASGAYYLGYFHYNMLAIKEEKTSDGFSFKQASMMGDRRTMNMKRAMAPEDDCIPVQRMRLIARAD